MLLVNPATHENSGYPRDPAEFRENSYGFSWNPWESWGNRGFWRNLGGVRPGIPDFRKSLWNLSVGIVIRRWKVCIERSVCLLFGWCIYRKERMYVFRFLEKTDRANAHTLRLSFHFSGNMFSPWISLIKVACEKWVPPEGAKVWSHWLFLRNNV